MRRAIENVGAGRGIPMMMQGYNLEDARRGIDEMMIRQPLGVVAAIVPFNFPGHDCLSGICPMPSPLGNTFILKPSERVPLTMRYVYGAARKNRDSVGAGDAFNAGLAVGLAEGQPMLEAIALGVTAASLSTQSRETIESYRPRAEVDRHVGRVLEAARALTPKSITRCP